MVGSNPGVITRTYSVTDDAGNSINVTQTITVDDTINPTATNPTAITVECIGDVPTADITVVTDESDNCTASPTVAFVSDSALVGSNPGVITRTYSVTDDAGNRINVTQTITVDDTINPTATNPTAVTVECIGDVPTADITVVTDETDNCTVSPTVAYVSDSAIVGSNPGVITRTYSVTDTAGNSINVTQKITVEDTIDPTATNPTAITVECIGDVPTADITVVTDETDNCTVSPTVTFVSDSAIVGSNPGVITRTYSVTDTAGNSINVTQKITVEDTIDPTATNPTAITVECIGDVPTADITVVTDESDNCTASPTVSFVSDSALVGSNPGVITRTYSVTDEAGNSINVTQTITVDDTINPTATNPTAITVECIGDVPTADITVITDETDNCTASPTVAFVSDSALVGSNPGVITRTYSVTDDAGNSINVTQTITVDDTINPTATNPTAITVECIGDVPTADITVVTDETDNCTASPTVVFVSDSALVGSNPGVITRTYSVTDDAGNSINVTQTITVSGIAPDIIIGDASAIEGGTINFPITLSKVKCDENLIITFTLIDGTANELDYKNIDVQITIPIGTTTASVSIPIFEDTLDELNENFVIAIKSVDFGLVGDTTSTATGTIIDNDEIIDQDNDGIIDSWEDLDIDGDNNPATNPTDSDNDGIADYLDIDSDNDGIPDNVEAQTTIDYVAPSGNDVNNNGLDDVYESNGNLGIIPVNTDNEDLPDYIDTDSDNDGIPDNIEGNDYNHDGIADFTLIGSDKDNDGLDDAFEGSNIIDADPNDEINEPYLDLPNTDEDGESDYRDSDDDDDGINTVDEDLNNNGNYADDDSDSDGTPNYLDNDLTISQVGEIEVFNVITPNGDGVHDFLKLKGIENFPDNDVSIFNRWGIVVYQTKSYNNVSNIFDGTSNARSTISIEDKLPVGTYFYIINYKDVAGVAKKLSGYIYINK